MYIYINIYNVYVLLFLLLFIYLLFFYILYSYSQISLHKQWEQIDTNVALFYTSKYKRLLILTPKYNLYRA